MVVAWMQTVIDVSDLNIGRNKKFLIKNGRPDAFGQRRDSVDMIGNRCLLNACDLGLANTKHLTYGDGAIARLAQTDDKFTSRVKTNG